MARYARDTRVWALLVGVGIFYCLVALVLSASGEEDPEYEVVRFALVPDAAERPLAVLSSNGRRLAYWARRGGEVVRENDTLISLPELTRVCCPVFHPDSERLLYFAPSQQGVVVTINTHAGNYRISSYFDVLDPPLAFSADGTRWAVVAKLASKFYILMSVEKDGQWNGILFRGGQFHPEIEWARDPVFPPKGDEFAHAGHKGDKWIVMKLLRQDIQLKFDDMKYLSYSPDGRHVAYWAKRGDREMIMIDDRQASSDELRGVGRPVFGPDSKTLAYSASTVGGFAGKWFMTIAGKQISPAFSLVGDPVFRGDGHALAYRVGVGDPFRPRMVVMVDGRAVSPEFDDVTDPAFIEGGNLVFAAWNALERKITFVRVKPPYRAYGVKPE